MSPYRSARGDEAPALPVARVDLHPDGAADEEHLVTGGDGDRGRDVGPGRFGVRRRSNGTEGGAGGDEASGDETGGAMAVVHEVPPVGCC